MLMEVILRNKYELWLSWTQMAILTVPVSLDFLVFLFLLSDPSEKKHIFLKYTFIWEK